MIGGKDDHAFFMFYAQIVEESMHGFFRINKK